MSRAPERRWDAVPKDTHECPAPWCDRRVPPTMFACRSDWFYLPQHLRDDIWAGYRNQDDGGAAHRTAMATAITYYHDNPR